MKNKNTFNMRCYTHPSFGAFRLFNKEKAHKFYGEKLT